MADTETATPVKPEQLEAFLRQYRPEKPLTRERDVIAGRYRILTAEPLHTLSTSMARAFAAQDMEDSGARIYALVFDANAFPRKKHISALKEFRHPNLVSVVEDGVADISIYAECRYVVVLERPGGQPLSELLTASRSAPVSEMTVVNYLIRPFTEILKAFATRGISHGRINLSNVYINGSTILLGECVSEPSGYSQETVFETVDRLLCSPYGKNDFSIDADCYALGVLALHLLLGFAPWKNVSAEDFINSLLLKGSYHTLVVEWDLPENLQDLFRALMNDAKRDRCAPEAIENWLSGRRFNLILPAIAHETNRGFEFQGKTYFNRKALAHALYTHWAEAKAVLFDQKLPRWLETSVHKKEQADAVSRIASNNMGDTAKAERHNNELISRIILTLDPHGPVRCRSVAVMPDGIGAMLASAYFTGNQEALQSLYQVIDSDLPSQWVELQKQGTDYSFITPRLLKMRNHLRQRSPGFGIERCVYDMHPSLPCQSPLIRKLAATSLKELMLALDTVSSSQKASETDFMDVHVAAFIASKLEIAKEIRVHELDAVKELASNPRMVSIKLLARAQGSLASTPLKGLTYWIALRMFSMMDYLHKRSVRSLAQQELRKAAETGSVGAVSAMLLNPDIFVNDYVSFVKAYNAYAQRRTMIHKLRDPRERIKHARMVGRGLAQTIAYGTCLFTVYFTLRSYYHF